MKKALAKLFVVTVAGVGFTAWAAPTKAPAHEKKVEQRGVKLDKDQLKKVAGGKITKVNNGGQTPNGEANGIPAKNPAGHAPPGHN